MSRRSKRLRAPGLLIAALAALAALLVFAATASAAAETRTGESTTASTVGAPSGEALLVKSTASLETATGHAVISFTTAAPPSPAGEAAIAGGFSSQECSSTPPPPLSPESELVLEFSSPLFIFEGELSGPRVFAITGTSSSPGFLPMEKSVSGATTTLSVTSGSLAEAGFKCAVILVEEKTGASLMTFPIKAPPPPPPPAPVVTPAPAPAPLPAPAVLSVAKPKPLKAKAKTWKTVHIKVSNTGATATAQGSLRVKPAKGVLVKPEVQKLPILTPGASFTLSVRVQLTETAKSTSKLPVTVTAPDVSGTGSIVLKLKQ
jgi:hypothetical protein